jgi:shikimate kinase
MAPVSLGIPTDSTPFSSYANNLILIGLPGSGKSTIGVQVADSVGYHFIDTDRLIEEASGRFLQQIVDSDGAHRLRAIEAEIVSELAVRDTVIATGGSVVYYESTMRHLQSLGPIIYLRARDETILERIGDYSQRGIARMPGQSIQSVIAERLPLYARFADVVIDVDGLSESAVTAACIKILDRTR